MCILTQREIEVLTGLQSQWWKLYWRELARIVAANTFREVQREAHAVFWRESPG
jgi:hypothetical protein